MAAGSDRCSGSEEDWPARAASGGAAGAAARGARRCGSAASPPRMAAGDAARRSGRRSAAGNVAPRESDTNSTKIQRQTLHGIESRYGIRFGILLPWVDHAIDQVGLPRFVQ